MNDFQLVMQGWSWNAWVDGLLAGQTRPLSGLARGLGYTLSGVEPWGYHAVSIGLHVLNGVLFACLAHRVIGAWAATVAVGLFLLHPVQVEAVAYISSQADLVSAAGLLLALLCVERGWLLAAWIACGLAVLGKETAVAAFALVPLWVLWRFARVPPWVLWRSGWSWRLGVWALSVMVPAAYVAVGRYTPTFDPIWVYRVMADTLGLLTLWVVPYPLSIEHDWSLLRLGLGVLGVIALSVASVPARLAVLWCVVVVLPRLPVPQLESLHEHHAYPMVIGLSLCAGYWFRAYQPRELYVVARTTALPAQA